ncbi:MAG: aminotransferase class V-fold PLP-dependent enzyme [Bacteroidota bacterium]|nr:aminotransferase class V-fold PLP-dependent enzyme [Bacteroidota bacterium]
MSHLQEPGNGYYCANRENCQMPRKRNAQVDMDGAEFKKAGYRLIDQLGDFIDQIGQKPVTADKSPAQLSEILGRNPLPEHGQPAIAIVDRAADLLCNFSLLNGHPRFLGYITSSAAPIGALADLLAAAVNPNVGAHILSPMATAIEKQVIKWLGELIGLPPCYDGILVSGGNMANFTAFFAAVHAKVPESKAGGIAASPARPLVYCSRTTHTWIEKAAALSGLGGDSIRWIATDKANRMDLHALQEVLQADKNSNQRPIMIIGTAGDVSTGAVDDLKGIAEICKRHDCWLHIDGAYGLPAAAIPEQRRHFEGMAEADSIALDPHKWLYAPLEAGCTLVKNPNHLIQTYSSHPVYYNFNQEDQPEARNYYEYGFQNSRGFRALKVWMVLQQAGRKGYMEMIATDIRLAALLFRLASQHAELEAITQNLSITTLRYRPPGLPEDQLNQLNELLLNDLQRNGEVFLSNAVIDNKYCLRACIVNFRTSDSDIEEIVEIILRGGRKAADHIKNKSV